MDLDSELIILEVEKYPCIYNLKDCDFKNRDKKRESWLSVTSAVVGEIWETMDSETKTSIGKEVQKRWKSMKDSYIKSIKAQNLKSGDSAKIKKGYVYQKQMSFLQSVVQQRETTGNMNAKDNSVEWDDEINSTESNEKTRKILKSRVNQDNIQRSSKKRKIDSFEEEIVKVLKENSVRPPPEKPDPDEMFLLSQLPVIKQMKMSDKLDFQLKFIQLLQSYSSPYNAPRTSIYPNSISPSFSNIHHNEKYSPNPSTSLYTTDPSSVENNVVSDDDASLISFFSL